MERDRREKEEKGDAARAGEIEGEGAVMRRLADRWASAKAWRNRSRTIGELESDVLSGSIVGETRIGELVDELGTDPDRGRDKEGLTGNVVEVQRWHSSSSSCREKRSVSAAEALLP